MARRYSRRGHRRGGFKLPVISLAILGGQIGLAMSGAVGSPTGWFGALDSFQSLYTGYDFSEKAFRPERLIAGYAPWLAKRFIMPIAHVRLPIRGLPISLS